MVTFRWQPSFINPLWIDQLFSVCPAYYLILFQGLAFLRPPGIMTVVAAYVNPAIGSVSTVAIIARMYVPSSQMDSDAKSVRQ